MGLPFLPLKPQPELLSEACKMPALSARSPTQCGIHWRTHLRLKKVCEWDCDEGTPQFYDTRHHPEAAILMQRWNRLTQAQRSLT